jgi:FlaA1/EpsC-like NDP-sugar epimerase
MKKILSSKYSRLERRQKKIIMFFADMVLVPIALWAAWALRLSDVWPEYFLKDFWWLFPTIIPISVFIYSKLGLYQVIVRYISSQALVSIFKGSMLMALVLWSLVFISRESGFPRSIPIIFAMVLFLLIGSSRLVVRWMYHRAGNTVSPREAVAIYGAGDSGMQLVSGLLKGRDFAPVIFLDDNPQVWKFEVHGIPVYNPKLMDIVLAEYKIKRVLLAIPTATLKQRKAILDKLEPFGVHVQTIPSFQELVSGKALVEQLQEVSLEDLLGRDAIPPMPELFEACIKNKVVLVTGGGGSIGSELCRQIIVGHPRLLVIYEQSEYSLYAIEQELLEYLKTSDIDIPILPILGSVCNRMRLNSVFGKYNVQTVYHAAAYKHVPLVEHNVFEGIRNNIFGTKTVAELAAEHGVERFVLVSTDKAVRPTNVMGATKRFAEQIVQLLACKSETVFCMVRFGNVLGSSGSVVPLFRKQIEMGGPVTVTHPKITRFFMTIPEASQLVIQAGSMAEGGDVFVLDMGEPVKVVDLARRMIELSGYDVSDDEAPNNGIQIIYSGLRPGEKLFEELLIGEDVFGTLHPKIMRANEEFVAESVIDKALVDFESAELNQDSEEARIILQTVVGGFRPNSPLVDFLHA